jgi:UDP-N-acetylmuramyl pentapeptide phosphotransferase/UDP-N-acetylglucosamine-1-phosphate transferase
MLTNSLLIWFSINETKFNKRNDNTAIQASHVMPAARIGGISIVFSTVLAATLLLETFGNWSYYRLLLFSTIPVFAIGLCEDFGYLARPIVRLLASVLSGVILVGLTGEWLLRTDIPGFDLAMQWAPFGIAFSLFVAAGVSHSFNLIDGLNGFAGFIAIGVSLSLAILSYQMGLKEHYYILFFLSSAIAGFLVFNFPLGKIFLGDAGAYFIGHILIWMGISILCAAPIVTPIAMLLIFFWPVADTLLAIVRRVSLGVPISYPDRLHFHQLVLRGIEIVILGRKRRHIANPLATIIMLPLAFTPMAIGVLLALDRGKSMIALILFSAIFIIGYRLCIRLVCRFRRSVWDI